MGDCMSSSSVSRQEYEVQKNQQSSPKIQEVDIVKVKLKTTRDRINNFINSKNKDINQIDIKINEKIPTYQKTGNKKQLIPLLKTKKDLNTFIQNAEIRLKLINDKLREVQMQKVNVDTIIVLEDSNKYIKLVQNQLQAKDWRNVLQDAKNKYQLQWPQDDQNLQNDPKFQQLWAEIGGNKIPAKKTVNVNTNTNLNTNLNNNVNQRQTQQQIINA